MVAQRNPADTNIAILRRIGVKHNQIDQKVNWLLHIAEELWKQLGHEGSIATVAFPIFEASYLVESEKEYPVSFNGKMRFKINLPLDLTEAQIEEIVMKDERTIAQLAGNTPKKVIIVPGKVINLVG